jgi:hypothetical protein
MARPKEKASSRATADRSRRRQFELRFDIQFNSMIYQHKSSSMTVECSGIRADNHINAFDDIGHHVVVHDLCVRVID